MRFSRTIVGVSSAALGLVLALTPSIALAATTTIPGISVSQTVNELPAPVAALASDGRTLIVYQDANPATEPATCTQNGGECAILGSIVDADGATATEPFVISGETTVDYYREVPSVTWNEDRQEWLVLYVSYSTPLHQGWAQRVSSSGELVGNAVEIPVGSLTTAEDRETLLSIEGFGTPRHLTARWSSADQAYLVTWHVAIDATISGFGRQGTVGYLMTGELAPADGVETAFLITDRPNTHQQNSKVAYSATEDAWMVLSVTQGPSTRAWAQTVTYAAGAVTVNDSVQVASSDSLAQFQFSGGVTYVDSADGWMVSWNARPTNDVPWNAYGRLVTSAGSLGDIVALTDFGALADGGVADWMPSHHLFYDIASNTVYGAGSVESSATSELSAVYWTFDVATLSPIDWFQLIAPNGEGALVASSRAQITGMLGGVGVVYQNWPAGSWRDPAEVRYHLPVDAFNDDDEEPSDGGSEEPGDGEAAAPGDAESDEPELAATGADTTGLLVVASLLVGVGVVTTVVARRRASV